MSRWREAQRVDLVEAYGAFGDEVALVIVGLEGARFLQVKMINKQNSFFYL